MWNLKINTLHAWIDIYHVYSSSYRKRCACNWVSETFVSTPMGGNRKINHRCCCFILCFLSCLTFFLCFLNLSLHFMILGLLLLTSFCFAFFGVFIHILCTFSSCCPTIKTWFWNMWSWWPIPGLFSLLWWTRFWRSLGRCLGWRIGWSRRRASTSRFRLSTVRLCSCP